MENIKPYLDRIRFRFKKAQAIIRGFFCVNVVVNNYIMRF